MNCSYNRNNNNIESHLNCLSKSVDSLLWKYENIFLLGDFNSCMDDSPMIGFCETYKLRNLVKHTNCFENLENPSCIDFLLTSKPLSFQTTTAIETGLSDFHKIIVAVMKMHFPKMKPRVIRYQKYKIINNDAFINTLRKELTKQKKFEMRKGLTHSQKFVHMFLINTPLKIKRYLRSNHKPFMNNEISKAIMTKTRLRNRFLKNRSNRNRSISQAKKLCVSLKKYYFSKLNEKQITDNKRFWITVKPFLLKKVQSSEKINLTEENNSLVADCTKIAKEVNSFFSSVVRNLNIPN